MGNWKVQIKGTGPMNRSGNGETVDWIMGEYFDKVKDFGHTEATMARQTSSDENWWSFIIKGIGPTLNTTPETENECRGDSDRLAHDALIKLQQRGFAVESAYLEYGGETHWLLPGVDEPVAGEESDEEDLEEEEDLDVDNDDDDEEEESETTEDTTTDAIG